MIVFLNGAFGIGKTTVARALVRRLPRARLFDPELLGVALQRITGVSDFQDLRLWRRLTVLGLRVARMFAKTVVVPMAISNPACLREIRDGLRGNVRHFCLIAPYDVVRARLQARGHDAGEWELHRARECCDVHGDPAFAEQVRADRPPDEIVDDLLRALRSAGEPPA